MSNLHELFTISPELLIHKTNELAAQHHIATIQSNTKILNKLSLLINDVYQIYKFNQDFQKHLDAFRWFNQDTINIISVNNIDILPIDGNFTKIGISWDDGDVIYN